MHLSPTSKLGYLSFNVDFHCASDPTQREEREENYLSFFICFKIEQPEMLKIISILFS